MLDWLSSLTVESFLRQNIGMALLLSLVAACYLLYKLKDAVNSVAFAMSKEFNAIRLEWIQFNSNQNRVVSNMENDLKMLSAQVKNLSEDIKAISVRQDRQDDKITSLQNLHLNERNDSAD